MSEKVAESKQIPVVPLKMEYLRDEATGTRLITQPVSKTGDLDTAALTVFLATGMFLDNDTYFKDLKTVECGVDLELDANGVVLKRKQRFNWDDDSASERFKSSDACVDKLEALLDSSADALGDGAVLAVSGGLDSRSLAASLSGKQPDLVSYSYAFEDGIDELKYSREVSRVAGFQLNEYTIPSGYLWNEIERFPELTNCYAEFTHPRQMAVIDNIASLGDTFVLGHLGDILFDDLGLSEGTETPSLAEFAFSRVARSSGVWLAGQLWQEFGMCGTFDAYFRERLMAALEVIKVEDPNVRMRAFKCLQWVPRWSSVNLSVFRAAGRMVVPYYTNEMCEFVRSVPKQYLEGRHLQIEYIKRKNPMLANLAWQAWAPFNLYDYKSLLGLRGIPVRIAGRLDREVRRLLGRPRVRQNWQNQFLGAENSRQLSQWLFETEELRDLVPLPIVRKAHARFVRNPTENWHAVSMLLTLAVFGKHKQRWIQNGG